MFNSSNIGKLYIANDSLYMVTGYNYLLNQYTTTRLDLRQLGFVSSSNVKEEDEKKFFDYENFYIELDKLFDKRFEKKKYLDIYEKNHPKKRAEQSYSPTKDKALIRREVDEYVNSFNRLKETYTNIKALKFLLKHAKDKEQKDLYTRELIKTEKGLRRALKVVYRYMSKEDYDTFLVYLIENDYENIQVIKGQIDFETKKRESLIKIYEYTVDNYESFIESFRMLN